MKMTLEQYVFYKSFAESAFYFLSKKINRYIIPYLIVDPGDLVNFTFANIRRPNIITIHMENIIAECGNGNDKNKVCSMIIITISHELFHVEQLMSQERYRSDKYYKMVAELSDIYATYDFLTKNKSAIDRAFSMNLDLSYIKQDLAKGGYDPQWLYKYNSGNVEQLYKYTIMNVIFRSDKSYNDFEKSVLDVYDDIVIIIDRGYNFYIKRDGEFCDSCLNEFVQMVGDTIGVYDRYTIGVEVVDSPYRDKSHVAYVTFTLSNRYIYPMIIGRE